MGIASSLVNSLQIRRLSQGHSVLGIQGDPGVGKSTLALGLALSLEHAFSVKNVYYNREEWATIAGAKKGSVFILDEGANVAMNRTWQEKSQVKLMQLLNMIRQRHHTLIWCTPNLQRLDVILREDLITHRINCLRRGAAKVRTRSRDRDGEPSGWKTWPGILSWPNLDKHPIWKSYYEAKEANFAASVNSISQVVSNLGDPFAE